MSQMPLESRRGVDGVVTSVSKSYLSLPPLRVVPLRSEREVFVASCAEVSDKTYVAARSVSTYPMVVDRITGKSARDGEPNADSFFVCAYENRAVLAIADGCNWGVRPYKAARSAMEGVSTYLMAHRAEMVDLPQTGHLLLRAIAEANRRISEGVADFWEAGTTTLLVAVILQVSSAAPPTSSSSSATPPLPGDQAHTQWGLLVASVGDCKALVFNRATGCFADVTQGNRCVDMRDPGGRLGPYIGKDPDLRNMRLYYREIGDGDVVSLCTDGVYDNLDPLFMGMTPQEAGLDARYTTWPSVPEKELEACKERVSLGLAQRLLGEKIGRGGTPTPKAIVDCLTEHAERLTTPMRQFMEQNPGKKQPPSSKQHPGKLDHTTAMGFQVGALSAV